MEGSEFGDRCAVCFEKMKNSIKLTCSHKFHLDCANQLRKTSNQCCICYEPIEVQSSKSENLIKFGKDKLDTHDSDYDSDNEAVKFMQEEENDNQDDD